MKTPNIKLISVAAGLAMMGAVGNANAEAYARSYTSITDGFFISNNLSNTFATPVNTSSTGATLSGFLGVSFSDVGTGIRDADMSTLGTPARTENVFNPAIPPSILSSYSGADAEIKQEQFGIAPGQGIEAELVSESNIAVAGSATATSENSSGTSFNVLFSVIVPGTITFSFVIDPFIRVLLDPLAAPGSKAEGTTNTFVTITDSSGAEVFRFAPLALNTSRSLFSNTANDITYDPVAATYTTTTGNLALGDYNVAAISKTSTSVIRVSPIPEPASLALVGLALAGLGLTRRRKQP